MMLVNGKNRETIAITDRGFQYGDGLFETIEVANGQPVLFDLHLERLKDGCKRLSIPFSETELLGLEAKALCQSAGKAVLKIIVTRGSGGRGYRQPELIQPVRVLSLHPFPDYSDAHKEQGIVARFCDTRLGLNPSLAGIKHLNRLEQVLARAEWYDPAVQEGIMLDINDHVIEGTMTNLFYVKNSILHTASLELAGIAGVMRKLIIILASEHKLPVIEHSFFKTDILFADEVFVSNSIIGLWPVRQIANTHFAVGPIGRKIQTWIDQYKRQAINHAQQ